MNEPQVILDNVGQPAFAVIPWRDYARLTSERAEALLSDEHLYDTAKSEEEESFPIEVADRLLAGENPIGVYRNHRNMTQQELAAASRHQHRLTSRRSKREGAPVRPER